MRRCCVVTIDGPAASGKSTTAREVAKQLDWLYLDTGAMYRALTVKVLRRGIMLEDSAAIGRIALETTIELIPGPECTRVLLDGEDVSEEIRLPEIDKGVGPVCEVDIVRKVLVELQRQIGTIGRVVAEGRDTGTVVFPDADLKFFMVASIEARAQRRVKELETKGLVVEKDKLLDDIRRRDLRDSRRDISPLRMADDAIEVDTTRMTIAEQVDFIIESLRRETDCLDR